MPASALSFAVTEAYREGLIRAHDAALASARLAWRHVDLAEFDETYVGWLQSISIATAAVQRRVTSLSVGYLTAFLTAEHAEPVDRVEIDTEPFVGVATDGRPIVQALGSPRVAILAELKVGRDNAAALRAGLVRAERMVGTAVDYAAQAALFAGMREDDRIGGWRRAVRGTCGACLGDTRTYVRSYGEPMRRHPYCNCVAEPWTPGVKERVFRPSGDEIFEAMTPAAQDAAVGPTIAERIRAGDVALTALVATSEQEEQPDFITQKPVSAL